MCTAIGVCAMSPGAGDEMRIGTAEREAALAVLAEQFAEGRLTAEEFAERTDAVIAALTQGQLQPLFIDLPVVFPLVLAPSAPPVSAAAADASRRAATWHRIRKVARLAAAGCVAMIVISSVHYWRTGDGHGVVPDSPGSRQWLILNGWQWLLAGLFFTAVGMIAGRFEEREGTYGRARSLNVT